MNRFKTNSLSAAETSSQSARLILAEAVFVLFEDPSGYLTKGAGAHRLCSAAGVEGATATATGSLDEGMATPCGSGSLASGAVAAPGVAGTPNH